MIYVAGRYWGTAAQVAERLGPDVSVAMVRNWHQRDGLTAHHVGRTVYYAVNEAARIERDKRIGGRGRQRRCIASELAVVAPTRRD
ncbi:hypothetical protein DER29_4330 [Micromonospora sp. M71_S20]|uniref:hypothetical protein n=1 Tax=Micromonospora sp. M71_S20 TaxID=592872 RepID=UPI000EB20161|nr:hypothetical protein [Micromonospora sp. M71_S20]RLK13312.1 hypothetical protein DER29_4330 [Micromonospora sp. M71_S20]